MTNHPNNPNNPNGLSAAQLEQLTAALREEKEWLDHHFEADHHYGLEDSLRIQTGELSAYDNHPGDLGSETFERGKDLALNENASRHLSDVNDALQRMEAGDYGLCRTCGQPIPFERLQAMPTAAYCINHVPTPQSAEHDRPIEEEVMSFGRSSLDEKQDQTEFDGEDAWQIVESWGSSNTPAMAENPNESDNYSDMEVEPDENVGYVESFESFVATDMYGKQITVVRNKAYQNYMHSGEGDGLLEPERSVEDDYN
ncbi:TraR/DksA C4-type zinc finger protein [Paenibacillus cremeus]|uniref:Molecular chaperone DnaK n=1 Tax=Paenibacillus cremeus TaxID=2163881 RepID=A0A559KBS4_9BACL|nr:TraR/DksA C4-type zinc finger protein [Paenibacillus cremeus]TVY09580.1 molecular chaperone DnaK [Paenibacillus cremeus]